MKQRELGRSGLMVSVAGLGCNNFGARISDDAARLVIDKAFDVGITLFDTADVYGNRGGSETTLGKLLGDRRKRVVLATKFGRPMDAEAKGGGTSRRYVSEAVEASLKRLRTEWIDLLQIHWPCPETPIEETLRGLDDVVRAGKVRQVACSNFAAWQLVEAQRIARRHGLPQFVSTQEEYSLIDRRAEKELVPAMLAYHVSLLPYLPLAGGFLSGKYPRGAAATAGMRLDVMPNLGQRYLTAANWDTLERVEAFAKERRRGMVEIACGWLAARPTVASVMAGATRPEQVAQNAAASNCELSAEELAALDALCAQALGGTDKLEFSQK